MYLWLQVWFVQLDFRTHIKRRYWIIIFKWKGYHIYIFLLSNLIKYMRSQSEWYSLDLSWKHFLSELRVQMSLARRCCFHQRLISEHAGSRFLYLHLCYFYSPKVQGGILMYISPIRCFVFLSFWGKERERWERERVETRSIYTYSVI